MRPWLAAALLTIAVLAAPERAMAEPAGAAPPEPSVEPADSALPPRPATPAQGPRWKPEWRRVDIVEYIATPVLGGALLTFFLTTEPPPPRWEAPILFDKPVRDAIRARSEGTIETLEHISDGLLYGLLAYPVAVDVPVALARGRRDLAWQLLWQDALVISTATLFDIALRDAVGRVRPDQTDCAPKGSDKCKFNAQTTRSFPGGHFMMTTATSSLLCTQHLHARLYGGTGDAILCASALSANMTVGVMRVINDSHWATDIAAGGLLGSAVGAGLPALLWYRERNRAPAHDHASARRAEGPMALPMPLAGVGLIGVGALGIF